MAGMTFVPRVAINASSGITDELRDVIASLECSKIVKNALGGGSRVELKLKNGKPLTILAPLLEVRRGASTVIPKYDGAKRTESSAKPSMVLHVDPSEPGNKEFVEFMNLLDDRAKAICVGKLSELETTKLMQKADHLDEVYKTWDHKAKAGYAERNATSPDASDAPLFVRVKIMSRKDSDFHEPANWLVPVKYVDEDGSIKKYADAGELKKGNMKVQAGLEVNCVMKSSEGYSLDVQLRDVLILERLDGDGADNGAATAQMDPGVASFLEKKRKMAAAKASQEDGATPKVAKVEVSGTAAGRSAEAVVPVAPSDSKEMAEDKSAPANGGGGAHHTEKKKAQLSDDDEEDA
jgi:hypothetical protein